MIIINAGHEATSILLALQYAIGQDYGPVNDFKNIRDDLKKELEMRGY